VTNAAATRELDAAAATSIQTHGGAGVFGATHIKFFAFGKKHKQDGGKTTRAGDGGRPRRPAMATQLGSIKRVRRFPGFVVDGFNYQSPDVVAYFLTHFHADHTVGLHAGFKGPAPIYCSAVTAALVTNVMGVKPSLVRAVPLNDTVQVHTADGAVAFVTFLDANHCPGSATIHFRRRRGADEEDASLKEEKKKASTSTRHPPLFRATSSRCTRAISARRGVCARIPSCTP
jgi:hypothetical protein